MSKKDLGILIRDSMPIEIVGLNTDDLNKIEEWYKSLRGKKKGLKLIGRILSKELKTNCVSAISIEPIDDVSFILIDGGEKVLVSLVLNSDKRSKIILAKTKSVTEYSFILKAGLISDKVYVKKNLSLENERVYKTVLDDILGFTKEEEEGDKDKLRESDLIEELRQIKNSYVPISQTSIEKKI